MRPEYKFNPVQLIEEVRRRPGLYHSEQPAADREEKLRLWRQVGAVLYPDWSTYDKATCYDRILTLQRKWRSLRDAYNREIRLRRAGPCRNRRVYIYFKRMAFLGKHDGALHSDETGGQWLLHAGHAYFLHRQNLHSSIWTCSNKKTKLKCNGSVKLDSKEDSVKPQKAHGPQCPPEHVQTELRKILQEMNDEVFNRTEPVRKIYDKKVRELKEKGLERGIPKFSSVRSLLYRARNQRLNEDHIRIQWIDQPERSPSPVIKSDPDGEDEMVEAAPVEQPQRKSKAKKTKKKKKRRRTDSSEDRNQDDDSEAPGGSDSDRLFLLSFLPEMRRLPANIKMWARTRIANVMQEAVTYQYENQPLPEPPADRDRRAPTESP